jgi:predicted GIY-YIG superfamily endonuclease
LAVSKALVQLPTKPHALYRFFDRADVLLYVGISASLPTRIAKHRNLKPWWTDVRNITVEYYDTRDEAIAAETEAIKSEKPLYNTTHNELAQSTDGVPQVVTWTPHGPRAEEITVEWVQSNWDKLPHDVRHAIETPAFNKGCLGLAEDILAEVPDEDARDLIRQAKRDAAADDLLPQLAEDKSYVAAQAAISAYTRKAEDAQRLEVAADRLFEKLPTAVREVVLGRAKADVDYHQGPDHSQLDVTCWAVFCLAYAIQKGEINMSLGTPPPRGDPWPNAPASQ